MFPNATDNLIDQRGDIGPAKPFLADANHRWTMRTAQCQQPMKVGVQCDDDLALAACKLNDLEIGCMAVPDIGDVAGIDTSFAELGHGTARQPLVQ